MIFSIEKKNLVPIPDHDIVHAETIKTIGIVKEAGRGLTCNIVT